MVSSQPMMAAFTLLSGIYPEPGSMLSAPQTSCRNPSTMTKTTEAPMRSVRPKSSSDLSEVTQPQLDLCDLEFPAFLVFSLTSLLSWKEPSPRLLTILPFKILPKTPKWVCVCGGGTLPQHMKSGPVGFVRKL